VLTKCCGEGSCYNFMHYDCMQSALRATADTFVTACSHWWLYGLVVLTSVYVQVTLQLRACCYCNARQLYCTHVVYCGTVLLLCTALALVLPCSTTCPVAAASHSQHTVCR
jgi:hypothetical protein